MSPVTGTSVIIVNYRTMELTRDAVASVLPEPEVGEVVVVDNASGDGSASFLRAAFGDGRVRVVESETNVGFGPAVNLAAGHCAMPLLLILNSDATLAAGSLGRLARALTDDESAGAIGPAVYLPDGRLQPGTYGRLPRRSDVLRSTGWAHTAGGDPALDRAPGWISGVAMLLRKDDFEAVGGFDPAFGMYLEDVDLCRRLGGLGKRVLREPSAAVTHHVGKSWRSARERTRSFHASKLRYFQRLGAGPIELGCIRALGALRTAAATRPSRPRRR